MVTNLRMAMGQNKELIKCADKRALGKHKDRVEGNVITSPYFL